MSKTAGEKRQGKSSGSLGPLPGGHHGLSRRQVEESQRERLLAAIVTVVAARGYRGATVTAIVKEATVSSRVFYEFVSDKEEAFRASFDAVVDHLEGVLVEAAEREDDWPRQTVAVLTELTRFFTAEPELARFCLIEPATATPELIAHFRATVLRGVPFLRRGRAEHEDGDALPASTEDSIIGGLLSLATAALLSGSPPLADLVPDLAEFALAPYLGPDRAREVVPSG